MSTKSQVRIVKRTERDALREDRTSEHTNSSGQLNPEPKRDAVTIVTEWIGEMKRRKSAERTRALKSLFPEAA